VTVADRRAEIVHAALDVIREGGLGSFTQPRVARRAELRQSHLTYYFPTRDDLLAAVAREAVEQRVAVLAPIADAEGGERKLAALVDVLVAPGQTRVFLALIQSAELDDAVRASMAELGRRIAPLGASLLTAFGVPVTPTALDALQTASTGVAVLALAQGGEAFRPRGEAVLTALLTGLVAHDDSREARSG
jgi:AcrR family transcriptional regulator